MRKITISIVLCLSGAMLNIAVNKLCIEAGIPLYMDTILTISITLTCGLFWGSLCGALTNLLGHTIWGWGWGGYLFVICNIATALVVWLFMRLFRRELNLAAANTQNMVYKLNQLQMVMDRVIVLIILSFALCLVMSFLGGLIAAFILNLSSLNLPSLYDSGELGISAMLRKTMFADNAPVALSEIASRVPVNIVDRLISAFAGFGIALGIRQLRYIMLIFKSAPHY